MISLVYKKGTTQFDMIEDFINVYLIHKYNSTHKAVNDIFLITNVIHSDKIILCRKDIRMYR